MVFRVNSSPLRLSVTWMANLVGAGEDLLPEEPALEVEGVDGVTTLKGKAATIAKMAARHPEDCIQGTKGGAVMTSISSLLCWSVEAYPKVATSYVESLGWDGRALAVVKGLRLTTLGKVISSRPTFGIRPMRPPFLHGLPKFTDGNLPRAYRVGKMTSKIL